MKLKLFFLICSLFFVDTYAQEYIFGKVTSEENTEIAGVTVINIRTDERVSTNRDGHFMVSGRVGDELRFIKLGYERTSKKITKENIAGSVNVILVRAAQDIAEVQIKKGLTGDLKIDAKSVDKSDKVKKLLSDMDQYMAKKSDPRILAPRGGEFVQPVTKGIFTLGKVKNKWDDVDFMNYLIAHLGEKYFTDLQIDKPLIQNFIYYVFAGGFERKNILKYGYCSDADLIRFQRAVLTRIASYRAPQTQK
ncbi:carboxypeptidase-like regulatory domain-containing protein [Chryseobacterium sp.]|uniref:carboxypeptidase-like regulatory domain-containing protein n=1 Tax=Chryseobacterium sp. TaxID=1871047 RepID=UPI0025C0EE37|nr:carboxypeptidase-like regulatory domain-containing protein [Chryseobacterium sp.]